MGDVASIAYCCPTYVHGSIIKEKALDPKIANRVLAIVLTAATFLVTSDLKTRLWEQKEEIRVWPAVAATLFVFGVVLYIFNLLWHNINVQNHEIKLELELVKRRLTASEHLQDFDVRARIPNQSRFEKDAKEIGTSKNGTRDYQIVMIDLDNFGRINSKFLYRKGDEVIEYIAQQIYFTIRRGEFAYKMPEDVGHKGLRRVYRKYTGGDEFLILIEGGEKDAVGFLLRLHRRFTNEFNAVISSNILKEAWKMDFHAGVCPFYPGEASETAFARVEACLMKARQLGSPSRVFWYTKEMTGQPYVEACEEFKK